MSKSIAYQMKLILIFGLIGGTHASETLANICRRTPQVRKAIEDQLGLPCEKITPFTLEYIRKLDLSGLGISSLKAGDLSGLRGLGALILFNNNLTTVPVEMFAALRQSSPQIHKISLCSNPLDLGITRELRREFPRESTIELDLSEFTYEDDLKQDCLAEQISSSEGGTFESQVQKTETLEKKPVDVVDEEETANWRVFKAYTLEPNSTFEGLRWSEPGIGHYRVTVEDGPTFLAAVKVSSSQFSSAHLIWIFENGLEPNNAVIKPGARLAFKNTARKAIRLEYLIKP